MTAERPRRVFVAGHRGMVGSALVRHLEARPDSGAGVEIVTSPRIDLRERADVEAFLAAESVDEIYLAAAKVGGIMANDTYPAEFIHDNLLIACSVIHAAHLAGIQKLLFLGSSCVYPRLAWQPIGEEALLGGALESTNEPYAIAKIAGIKLCESYNRQYGRDYRSVMPTNLYGPRDNFDPEKSHVIPALLQRFHHAVRTGADKVVIWGSGTPRREFMHVDDLASACVHVMALPQERYRQYTKPMLSHLNVGTGVDCSIRELAELVARVTGFNGDLCFDSTKPDGTPRKLLDVSRLSALGWNATIGIEEGLRDTYRWFVAHVDSATAQASDKR